jgi:hypothetical protein
VERRDGRERLAVRFVRANAPGAPGGRVQEWRSQATGRVYLVREADAYAASEELEPGTQGFLAFVAGAPIVTREPRARGRGAARRAGAAPRVVPPPRPASARGRGWLWVIVAALVGWALLRLLARA